MALTALTPSWPTMHLITKSAGLHVTRHSSITSTFHTACSRWQCFTFIPPKDPGDEGAWCVGAESRCWWRCFYAEVKNLLNKKTNSRNPSFLFSFIFVFIFFLFSIFFFYFLLVSLQIPGHQAASWKADLYIFCGVLTSRPAQPGFCLVSGQQWNLRISYTSAYLLLFRTVWSAYLGCPSRMYHSPRPGVAQECGRKAEKKYFNFIITS